MTKFTDAQIDELLAVCANATHGQEWFSWNTWEVSPEVLACSRIGPKDGNPRDSIDAEPGRDLHMSKKIIQFVLAAADPGNGYAAALRELRELREHVSRLKIMLPPDTLDAHALTLDENNGGRESWMTDHIREYVLECSMWDAKRRNNP